MPVSGLLKIILFATTVTVALYSGYYLGKAHFGNGLTVGNSTAGDDAIVRGAPGVDFVLRDIDGVAHDTRQYRGRLLLINFWAPWCAPCREEVPLFIHARRAYTTGDLQILGLSLDGEERTRRFRDEYGINYPVLANAKQGYRILELYARGDAIPFSVLVGGDGRVLHWRQGAYQGDELTAVLQKAYSLARFP